MVGSIPAYYLGMYGGRPMIERYGRYVLISHRDLDMADRAFARHGEIIIFVGRLLPVVRAGTKARVACPSASAHSPD